MGTGTRQQYITLADGVTIKPVVNNLESGDPSHLTAGHTQINPPVIFNASKTIDFFAVVSDPAGVAKLVGSSWLADALRLCFSVPPIPPSLTAPRLILLFGVSDYKFKTEFTYDLGQWR